MVDQDHKRYFYFTSVLSTPSTSFNIKYYLFLVTYSIDLLAGLKITAGQRTMSGLIEALTGQTFDLPVMLTGEN